MTNEQLEKAWAEAREEIKAEIKSDRYADDSRVYGAGYEKGLYKALEIIEKHIGGEA